MLTFGQWMRQMREAHGLSLHELGRRTGYDAPGISRMETGKIFPYMYTAGEMCMVFDVTPDDIIEAVNGQQRPRIKNQQPIGVLTDDDVCQFLRFWVLHREAAYELLGRILMETVEIHKSKGPELGDETIFDSNDVRKILTSSNFYTYELNYPASLSLHTLQRIYLSGGSILHIDLQSYASNIVLRERQKQGLEEKEDKNLTLLERLSHNISSRITVNEAIALDAYLGEEGLVLSLYWRHQVRQARITTLMKQLHPEGLTFPDMGRDMKSIITLLTISRWRQMYRPDDDQWLAQVREAVYAVENSIHGL